MPPLIVDDPLAIALFLDPLLPFPSGGNMIPTTPFYNKHLITDHRLMMLRWFG